MGGRYSHYRGGSAHSIFEATRGVEDVARGLGMAAGRGLSLESRQMQGLLIAGLFVLGAACGAAIRLMVFIGVLIGGGIIAAAVAGLTQGAPQAGWAALVTIIALQIGYAAGFVLRAGLHLFLHLGK